MIPMSIYCTVRIEACNTHTSGSLADQQCIDNRWITIMSTEDTVNSDETRSNTVPLPQASVIRVFLDQTRAAFKTTLQHLAEAGVTIRSFTELHDHVVDVENGLSITQQLILQAYRHAVLVSTVEALCKQTDTATLSAPDQDTSRPGRDEG